MSFTGAASPCLAASGLAWKGHETKRAGWLGVFAVKERDGSIDHLAAKPNERSATEICTFQ